MDAPLAALKRMGRWPDFFILGAGKCGTTSLHTYLDTHPDLAMSDPKEPRFFTFEWDDAAPDLLEPAKEYLDTMPDEGLRAESSAIKLAHPKAPGRITAVCDDPRYIVMTRDPYDRTLSSYRMATASPRRDWRETRDLHCCVEEEMAIIESGRCPPLRRGHVWGSLYGRHLERWQRHAPRDRFHVDSLERLRADSDAVLEDIAGFLGVDTAFRPERPILNPGRNPSAFGRRVLGSRGVHVIAKFVPRPIRDVVHGALTRAPPARMEERTRRLLKPLFDEDRERLERTTTVPWA